LTISRRRARLRAASELLSPAGQTATTGVTTVMQ
jgi:hypothetical protein